MLAHPDIVPTDDNRFALGLHEQAPTFESRQMAEAVATHTTVEVAIRLSQLMQASRSFRRRD